jgi:hypothetical protein
MEDRVDGFRLDSSSSAVLSRVSPSPALPKSLDLSLSVFQTKRERKNKKERSGRKNEENKRIKKIIIKKE